MVLLSSLRYRSLSLQGCVRDALMAHFPVGTIFPTSPQVQQHNRRRASWTPALSTVQSLKLPKLAKGRLYGV